MIAAWFPGIIHQIREVFRHGDCYSDNLTIILNCLNYGTKDKVGLQNYCETYRVKATTVLRASDTDDKAIVKQDKIKKYDFEYQFSKCSISNSTMTI